MYIYLEADFEEMNELLDHYIDEDEFAHLAFDILGKYFVIINKMILKADQNR